MPDWIRKLFLVWILLAAASLRLTGLAWDEFLHYHPDERFIAWVGTTIEWPEKWDAAAFDPHRSTFNPFYWPAEKFTQGVVVPRDQPRDFAYGHLPLYLGVAVTRLSEWLVPHLRASLPAGWLFTQVVLNQRGANEFDQIAAAGRIVTALFDVGTIGLVYLLGRRLYGDGVGLFAAALLTVNVMHIQLAHFYTVDPFLAFFATACLYFLVASHLPGPRTSSSPHNISHTHSRAATAYLLLAGAMAGFAIGSKFAAILLLLPIAVSCGLMATRPRRHRLLLFFFALWVGFLAFFLTNPFAVLDQTCTVISPAIKIGVAEIPALNWRSCYLQNVVTQGAMANGGTDLGFTRQYAGSAPYLYFAEMQFKWGMGPLLAVAALLGLLWLSGQQFKQLRQRGHGSTHAAALILLAWVLPFLLFTGNFFVKFMRYLQPITPLLMLFAAAFLWQLRPRWLKIGAVTAVLLTTALYALAFANIYQERHPWAAASAWIYANIEPGAILYSEQWDDPLPTSLGDEEPPLWASQYVTDKELTWLTYTGSADNVARLQQNLELVAAADYLVISSHRVYAVVPRQPERFPLSSQYHQLLFSGALGYEPVYTGTRMPHLGNLYLKWDTFAGADVAPPPAVSHYFAALPGWTIGRADESFTVYDQPLPIILANRQRLSVAQMLAQFDLEP